MDYLIQTAQRDDIRGVVETAITFPSVQGVVLEVDPFWMSLWRLKSHHGKDKAEKIINRFYDIFDRFSPYGFGDPDNWLNNQSFDSEKPFVPSLPLDEYDFKNWKPRVWLDRNQYLFGHNNSDFDLPIIIKICLYPPSNKLEASIPSFQDFNLPVVFEARPPAYLYANPKRKHRPLVGGVSIGTQGGNFGTLGGIVRDNRGNQYGLTCSHVLLGRKDVYQPARTDSRHSGFIGSKRFQSNLHPRESHERCNPYITNNTDNEVDVALIQIDDEIRANLSILDIGELEGITSKRWLTPYQEIEVTGRSTGNSSLTIGGLAITYEFSFNSQKYCFKNLFELKSPSTIRTLLRRPIQNGDSGAWVCNASKDGFSWCGMVIGGDRWQGFAMFSETIEKWCNEEVQLVMEINENRVVVG